MNVFASQIKLCHNLLVDMRGQKEQESDGVMTRPPIHWKNPVQQTVSSSRLASGL